MEPGLADRLTQELPGIFNWALEGLRSLNAKGDFSIPESSVALLDELKPPPDSATVFLRTHCQENALGKVVTGELYQLYCSEVAGRDQAPLSQAQFGTALKRVFPKAEPKRETTGKRRHGYIGLELISDASRSSE